MQMAAFVIPEKRDRMNTVEPISDNEVVLDIADYLKDRNQCDYVMFMFGIYSGLRICDILQFRIQDVRGEKSPLTRFIPKTNSKEVVMVGK